MVEKIIDWSIKNRAVVFIISILAVGISIWSVRTIPLDAIPDLSPPQVIIYSKWNGQSPPVVEEQLTYPIVSTLISAPEIQTVRGVSSFETSRIYVIFKEGTDIYWARSRVLEYLAQIKDRLPDDAEITIGPDATGVGWVYQYALISQNRNLWQLRSLQDWYLKFALLGIDGVSEVASVGGYIKGYQITIKPEKLAEFNISLQEMINALKRNNNDTGGRVIEKNGFEFIIQGKGYFQNIEDIKQTPIKTLDNGLPVRIGDISSVHLVPMGRRGIADLNGLGEVVGGIVVMRYGENAYRVIQEVKKKLEEIKQLLPDDISIITTYNRSQLIEKAINTLKKTLIEEIIIVVVVVAIFLLHFRSALIVIITLPLAVLIGFIFMKFAGITSNIMSLGGIAIAIGALVDGAIIMVENAHKHIEKLQKEKGKLEETDRIKAIVIASKQVGRPVFFSLLVIVVSFLPVFALTGQEGQLFKPLAFTKTFTMLAASVLAITVVPALMVVFLKGKIPHENKNPLNRVILGIYSPIIKLTLKFRYIVVVAGLVCITGIYPLYKKFSWEFMPVMNEQTFMYMPVTPSGISVSQAKEITQLTDRIIASFPEVDTVFGKAGRADTATDPAPLSMIETIITLKPQQYWREGMTFEKLMEEMEERLKIPGLTNSWTYPIRGRIDMLITGIRTPLGIKIYGNDINKLQEIAASIETELKKLPETFSVFADRITNGYYINIEIDRDKISRYNLDIQKVQLMIKTAIGGIPVSTFYEKLERYPVLLRFPYDYRNNPETLKQLFIPDGSGRLIPLGEIANVYYTEVPSVIKSEKGMKVLFVYITPKPDVPIEDYRTKAQKQLEKIKVPEGYFLEWSGHSQYLKNAMERLKFIIPLTVLVVFLLVFFVFRELTNTLIVMLSLPFAMIGGLVYLDYLNFNMSIAVVIGFLALLGVALETAIVMVLYLEEALKSRKDSGVISREALISAVYEGAVLRVRPKMMTVFTILAGLLPIMYITGVGSEVMQRIAAPMIGGVVSSSILTLVVIPALYTVVKGLDIGKK